MKKELSTKLNLLKAKEESLTKKKVSEDINEFDFKSGNENYPSLAGYVQVESLEGKGRGAVARECLPAGQLVAKEEALAFVPFVHKVHICFLGL